MNNRVPARVEVFQKEDKSWHVKAIDESFKIEMVEPLPANYDSLPKRKYWLDRVIVTLGKRMKNHVENLLWL